MGKFVDLTGKRFGRLTVIKRAENKGRYTAWVCLCECGTKKSVVGCSLRSGKTRSCGCLDREVKLKRITTHGLTMHPLYTVHCGIVSRCESPKNQSYKNYGGRGITICKEWKDDFKVFYDWCMSNGYEKGLEIDRRNNDGNYEPSNCRFVTHRENNLNTRKQKSNTSGYEGVGFHKKGGKWQSYITIEGKRFYLGLNKELKDAVEARNNYIAKNNLQHEYKIQTYKESK